MCVKLNGLASQSLCQNKKWKPRFHDVIKSLNPLYEKKWCESLEYPSEKLDVSLRQSAETHSRQSGINPNFVDNMI